jgi:hypothetical protein
MPDDTSPAPATSQAEAAATPPVPTTEEKPKAAANAIRATYDNGLALQDSEGLFAIKLSFRNQIRFETIRC